MAKTYHQTILKKDAQGNVLQGSYTGDMTFRGAYTTNNLIYKGYSRPGSLEASSVWQISFITYDGSGNVLSVLWPQDINGAATSEFNFSWANRATYTYS